MAIKTKHNLLLMAAFAVTGTLSAGLIYLSIARHSDVSESNDKISQYRGELEKAHASKPAPVKVNRINLLHDAKELEKRAYQIQQRFGKYYRTELQGFASELRISEKTLTEGFRNYYRALPAEQQSHIEGNRDEEILEGYFHLLAQKRTESPLKTLQETLQKNGSKALFDTKFNTAFAQYAKAMDESNEKLAKDLEAFVKKFNGALVRFQTDAKKKKLSSVTAPNALETFRAFCDQIGLTKKLVLLSLGDNADTLLTMKGDEMKKLSNLTFVRAFLISRENDRIRTVADHFYAAVAKNTVQEITKDDNFRYLLAALGLPRTERLVRFSEKLKNYKDRLFLKKLIPGLEPVINTGNNTNNSSSTAKNINNFTFSDQAVQADVAFILRQMYVREDFFRRLTKTGISNLREIREISAKPISGTVVSESYLEYKYKVSLEGTMPSIRALINNMQQAVKENRVFVIRDLQVKRLQIENLDKYAKSQDLLDDEPLKLARDFQTSFKVQDKEKKEPGQQREDKDVQAERILASTYGKPQIGTENELLQADMIFSVLLYIGDEVARVAAEAR